MRKRRESAVAVARGGGRPHLGDFRQSIDRRADGGGEIAVTTFDAQTYKLAQSLKRSSDLSPPVANRLRSLIDSICDTMETARKKKR